MEPIQPVFRCLKDLLTWQLVSYQTFVMEQEDTIALRSWSCCMQHAEHFAHESEHVSADIVKFVLQSVTKWVIQSKQMNFPSIKHSLLRNG